MGLPPEEVLRRTRQYLKEAQPGFGGRVTADDVLAYYRHRYTNYTEMLMRLTKAAGRRLTREEHRAIRQSFHKERFLDPAKAPRDKHDQPMKMAWSSNTPKPLPTVWPLPSRQMGRRVAIGEGEGDATSGRSAGLEMYSVTGGVTDLPHPEIDGLEEFYARGVREMLIFSTARRRAWSSATSSSPSVSARTSSPSP